MGTATLNVRMPEELKRNGDRVLARGGLSVSEAVRRLYEEIVREQKIPDWLVGKGTEEEGRRMIEEKRKAIQSMAGIIPADLDLETVKRERVEREYFFGAQK